MKAIDHINRYVSDVEKFVDFYKDVLEYEVIDSGKKGNGKNYAILKGDSHELFISEKEDFINEKDTNFRHIGYFIENVEELMETMKSRGYVDKDQKIIVKPFSKQFYVRDPDGFEIDLIQWTDKQGFYDYLRDKMAKQIL